MTAAIKALRGNDGQPYPPTALCWDHDTVGNHYVLMYTGARHVDCDPALGEPWLDVTDAEPPLACVLCPSEPDPDDLPPGAQMRIDREIDRRLGK